MEEVAALLCPYHKKSPNVSLQRAVTEETFELKGNEFTFVFIGAALVKWLILNVIFNYLKAIRYLALNLRSRNSKKTFYPM